MAMRMTHICIKIKLNIFNWSKKFEGVAWLCRVLYGEAQAEWKGAHAAQLLTAGYLWGRNQAQLSLLEDVTPSPIRFCFYLQQRTVGRRPQSLVLNFWDLNVDLSSVTFINLSEAVCQGDMRSGRTFSGKRSHCELPAHYQVADRHSWRLGG